MSTKQPLIITEYPDSPVTESFRTLRTNIHNYKSDSPLKVIMFTSAGPKEGKSTVLANLAVTFAWSNSKILIIDCDLRKPVQSLIFGKANRGITDYLVKNCEWKNLIQQTEIANLDLLASGFIPPNPAELLASPQIGALLAELRCEYDYLLIDTPPVTVVTDACVMASQVDGIYLIVATNTVSPERADQTQELLHNANGRICGVVLNRVEHQNEYSYYYEEKSARKIRHSEIE
jgi:capsular exopolysaccharide synthesis family protein